MEKFCRLLPWLDLELAMDLLESLTGARVNYLRFMAVCEAAQIPAYLDCTGWSGEAPAGANNEQSHAEPVIGAGICSIDRPSRAYEDESFAVTGPAMVERTGQTVRSCKWHLRNYDESKPVIFRPADIETLAAKMNGAPELPPDKPLHPSERRSAGQIIAALAAMAGLDLSAPYAADETLRAAAATHGLELPSSSETVVKFLKDATARAGKS